MGDEITSFFSTLWEGLKIVAFVSWEGIKLAIQTALDMIYGIIDICLETMVWKAQNSCYHSIV